MTSPFSFEAMTDMGWLSAMLLAGVILRANIAFLQRFLFPSCLVGGVLGLCLIQTGLIHIPAGRLETIAYHLFNISFISVGLTGSRSRPGEKSTGKHMIAGALWMTLVQTAAFGMQAAAGCLGVFLLAWLGTTLFPSFGLLLPLGFEEGPGQALSVGKVWEGFGFQHAATIGLAFAAIGYFFAFFVGVPLVNRLMKKRRPERPSDGLSRDVRSGLLSPERPAEPAGRLTMHTGNIDTLAYQAAVVGGTYLITYGLMRLISGSLPPDAARIVWGFFFILGLLAALMVRWCLKITGVVHTVDPGVQRRITGWAVDFLIVATVMAIQVPVIRTYWGAILIMSAAGGFGTLAAIVSLGRSLTSHGVERTAAVFGTVTGTVSCGLLLLRIADPEFRSPVAFEIALMNVFSVPVIGVCMLLVNGPVWWEWSVGLTLLAFCGIMAVGLVGAWLLSRMAPGPDATAAPPDRNG